MEVLEVWVWSAGPLQHVAASIRNDKRSWPLHPLHQTYFYWPGTGHWYVAHGKRARFSDAVTVNEQSVPCAVRLAIRLEYAVHDG